MLQKCYLYLILLFIPIIVFSQQPQEVFAKANSQVAVCVVRFSNKNGTTPANWGCGLILNGKYFATCYHIYRPDTNFLIKSIWVLYNIHYKNGILLYDSVSATARYKATKSQYDFSKHIYIRGDNSYHTDFIILKLKKKIAPYKLDFSTDTVRKDESLYSLGLSGRKVGDVTITYLRPSTSKYFFYYIYSPCSYIASLGDAGEGFSGTPIYNSKGKIVGVIQFGMDNFPQYFQDLHNKGAIPDDIYSQIVAGYKNGEKLIYAIPIRYLIEKYMNGYLNER